MLIAHDPVHAFMPYPPVAVPGSASGPLAGVSFAVKDIFDVAGYPTGCGNPLKLAQSGIRTTSNSAVTRLLDAGAIFVGKTHTEEMAWSLYGTNVHFGTPVNPAAPDHVPGGSSSGSASAVAAGLCELALGSDTGGSVRGPASFCGIYGLRPTHGALPLDHCMPLAPSLDTCGFFARDAATMMRAGDVLLPPDRSKASRLMIAQDLFARLSPASAAALAPMVAAIEAQVGKAAPVSIYASPHEPVYAAFRHIQSREVHSVHGGWVEHMKPRLGEAIAGRFAFARTVTDADVAKARTVRETFSAHMAGLLADDGVLIAPPVHAPAPRLDADASSLDAYRNEAMLFLQPAGLAGLPQLVIPAGRVAGAPLGISLIGSKGSDRALLAIARDLAY